MIFKSFRDCDLSICNFNPDSAIQSTLKYVESEFIFESVGRLKDQRSLF